MTRVLALLILLLPTAARATVGDCRNAGDGTPCAGPCIVAGRCVNHMCDPSESSPEGAACVSGSPCTTGDFCSDGQCRPGNGRVTCPGAGEAGCLAASCDFELGCVVIDICAPDGGQVSPDLGEVDLLTPAPDLARHGRPDGGAGSPRMSEVTSLTKAPLDAPDLGLLPDLARSDDSPGFGGFGTVRGSSLAGCTCELGGFAGQPNSGLLGLLWAAGLVALALRRKSR